MFGQGKSVQEPFLRSLGNVIQQFNININFLQMAEEENMSLTTNLSTVGWTN